MLANISKLLRSVSRRADFINRGFSGYTTKLCLPLLKQLFVKPEDLKNCALFTIWLGANDASLAEQKVGLPEYRSNLSKMITYLSSDLGLPVERIVLINPPPVDETKEDPDKPKIRTLENTRLYAEACIEVAKANGVECVDMFNALLSQKDWQTYLIDGLHFCRRGSAFVAERLTPVVESRLPPRAMIFPHWEEALKIDLRKPLPW
ncbi:unnamed protein product [Dibothriocephalus latus]|uniref:SGNH hydrolase-type esterase domain-containing protein n=1 Tax=Dibothriocephalus latus TaxID=60516 RepID=A0A3P6SU58_DIBLA|nr:unnamed protein product [Dibothriocephalus latus]